MKSDALEDRKIPLCIDLDKTLLRVDSLHEQLASIIVRPLLLLRVLGYLVRGKAAFKAQLAKVAETPDSWPLHDELLKFLREEEKAGRPLYLATAANEKIARTVASMVGLFQGVFSSTEERNLKGTAKADALVQHFGERGYIYAGDSVSDLPVWDSSAGAIVVGVSPLMRRRISAEVPVLRTFHAVRSLTSMIKLLRPHQWSKNLIVFLPMVASGAFSFQILSASVLAFVSFCFTASALYIWNDILDLDTDRRHASKKNRPIANGTVAVATGIGMIPILLGTGFFLGYLSGSLLVLLLYSAGSVSYSLKLKTLPLVDVFVLAGLYTVRLWAGGAATGIVLSSWLLGFCLFLFFALALLKRTSELKALAPGASPANRRSYTSEDLPVLSQMGIGASFCATLVLALYIQSDAAATEYSNPGLIWVLAPLLLFWQSRLWLATERGYMTEDPVAYSLKDWVSWCVAAVAAMALLVARFG